MSAKQVTHTGTIHILLALAALILIAVTGYAILEEQTELLERVTGLMSHVLIGILGWAIGRNRPQSE